MSEDFGKFPPIKATPTTPQDTGTITQHVPQAAEAIPEKLDIVVDFGDGANLLREARSETQRIAAAIDMGSGKMYVGDGHAYLYHKYKIPLDKFCKVVVDIDEFDNITTPYAFDARGEKVKKIEPGPLNNLVVETLKRYIKNEQPEARV